MKRTSLIPLVLIVLAAVGGVAAAIATRSAITLGLDLQGGASVVLAPRGGGQNVSEGTLEQAKEIIAQRVDGVGVAEPDITRQGKNIVVQLPGVEDTDRVLALVGQTAQLRFRPVLGQAAPTDQLTPREEDKPEQEVVLAELADGQESDRLRLGPSLADGTIVSTARASVNQANGQWAVDFELTGSGSRRFDEIAAKCFQASDPQVCPAGRLAIVLDGVVKSAPNINTANFGGTGQITGQFTEGEAKDLALVLRYGSLPIELETQQRQTVSATLGRESLNAGLLAGALGLALVLVYMVAYYRLLGLVVVAGLALSGALLYAILVYLSQTQGLALTLAGATGVVVSVGVTVDSYVVFFERLRDEVRSGRTVRTSAGRSFSGAWRTILGANLTSFIGAAILYVLTVGPVRGFAFTLALSTLLDLTVAWCFTRPVVMSLARSRFAASGRGLGVKAPQGPVGRAAGAAA